MRVLLIVPLPPPITGHSVASQTLLEGLVPAHDTAVVNLSVGSLHDGRVTTRRIREVGKVLLAVWRRRRWADVIYFTIAESLAGNLKDLLVYTLCAGRLRRMFVHLHGGTIGRELFDRYPGCRRVNGAFIKRLGGVIVSGPSHVDIFSGMIERQRIHMVPNSAADELFVDEADVVLKFTATDPIRILYISSMTAQKGYLDLLEAWLSLAPDVRAHLQLDFAGRFETEADRRAFESRIAGFSGVRYRGLVDPEEKRRLFAAAHVFCLPTRMFEGQPISILEAFASGCAVITTGQHGIRDVFTDGVNGFEARAGSVGSIAAALSRARDSVDRLRQMALVNRRTAGERYRNANFTAAVSHILENGTVA
jgi:glycosyltransferase involved in cell wall biosynthesis